MKINHFANLPIQENSQAAEARRFAMALAIEIGFSETDAAKVGIAVTEAATNQIKHAAGGHLLIRSVTHLDIQGIEVLALDSGPGMVNLPNSSRDGFSTAGSSGTGLGAINRQASFVEIYSVRQKGTAIFMQFWQKPVPPSAVQRFTDIGGVAVAYKGEEKCGDTWNFKQFVDSILVFIADGLGHGAPASDAAEEGEKLFSEQTEMAPASILKSLHLGLRSTRGAAGAVIEANARTGFIRYSGVGNTTGYISNTTTQRQMVSHNGTLGVRAQKIAEFNYEWPRDTLLIFTTDGLTTQTSLKDYTDLARCHCTLIAGVLYRDFNRGRDDATVVVVKRNAA